MKTNINRNREFTLIEFFLSSIALFLLVIILLPLFQKFELSNQKAQILSNLSTIRFHADLYFEVELLGLPGIPKGSSETGKWYCTLS